MSGFYYLDAKENSVVNKINWSMSRKGTRIPSQVRPFFGTSDNLKIKYDNQFLDCHITKSNEQFTLSWPDEIKTVLAQKFGIVGPPEFNRQSKVHTVKITKNDINEFEIHFSFENPAEFGNSVELKSIEGLTYGKNIELNTRNRAVVTEKLKKEDYTCQACGFRLENNGRFIIDCHHINPISNGKRETSPDDLISLCPICHRIAHLGNPDPYTVEEINNIPPNKPSKMLYKHNYREIAQRYSKPNN